MYYFIMNPSSQSKGSLEIWRKIRPLLDLKHVPYRIFATRHAGHAEELARRISQKDPGSVLVIIGGDGSIHEVLSGLTHPGAVTLGVIPAGSANDFARGMGLSKNPLEAVQTVLHPKMIMDMDVGCLMTGNSGNKGRFGVSAGVGFDAAVCHEALASRTKKQLNRIGLGGLTYSAIAARQIALYRPGWMEISLDGNEPVRYENVFFTAIMNQKYEGGGLMMTPGALPDDGRFELFVCGELSRQMLIASLPITKFGAHTRVPGPHYLHGRHIEIRTDEERPIHLDGESAGISSRLVIDIEEEKLPVIVG